CRHGKSLWAITTAGSQARRLRLRMSRNYTPLRERAVPSRASAPDPAAARRTRRARALGGELHGRRAVRPGAQGLPRPRPRDDLPYRRPAPACRQRPPPPRPRSSCVHPLPPGAPPPSDLPLLRQRPGNRPVRSARGCRAEAPARLQRGVARGRHLRHLRRLCVVSSWVAIPLASLTVLSTLLGGTFALRLGSRIHTLIALSGGIVVAVALFDVLPEAIDSVGDSRRVTTLVG